MFLCVLVVKGQGKLNTITQAEVQIKNTCMAFGGNIGPVNQHSNRHPRCYRTTDAIIVPYSTMHLDIPVSLGGITGHSS